MTQEELKKEMDDQTKTELDTYVEGKTAVIDQFDKGFTDINTQLEQGQTLMKEANDLQTQYTIDEIERQKAETQKGYEKEQKAAYVDYQKQINPYGAAAESMAAAGLDNSGYAESSKVAMYNQYQNRVGVAREALTTAIAEYNSSIAAAKVQNSVAMAQLAHDTLLKKIEYTASHYLKRTDLLNQLVEGKTSIVQRGNDRWLEVLDKINSASLFDDDVQPQLEEDKTKLGSWLDNAVRFGGETISNVAGNVFGNRDIIKGLDKEDDARNYLIKVGAGEEALNGLKSRSEWKKSKDQYDYKTYKDYLQAYISYYADPNQ